MENKFTSFAYEEERSTYTEGESRSKRSSILKPPKARAPLQEVNLGGSADETGDFDTLRKRRVSFAGVNSVKEFCSNAESAQVCHIQSYEETFSTSSDSSGAKSLLGTPKNVSSNEDKNFADDPMDLTDSIIDSNPIGPNNSAQVVRVEPVLTANAEGAGFLRNPQGQTWSARKSALEHEEGQSWNARSSHGPIFRAGGEYGVNPGGDNSDAMPRSAKPDELPSHWSCSMEMTEPLKKRTSTAQSGDTPFHFGQSASKPESDSGMEFTEAVGKMPNYLVDDNLGDASMEMTEAIDRGRKSLVCTSSNNKSASMEFTEVVRKNQTPFNFAQSPFSGTEPTEPAVAPHHEPMARHSLFTSIEKGQPLPRVSYSSTPGKSTAQSPGNKSSSDMEMTGVLSLSKASRLVAQEAEDDMDITEIVMPSMPLKKRSRLSTEDDDDPFPMGHHRKTDPADKENLKLPIVELSVSMGPEAEQLPVAESAPKTNLKPVEEDDDTLALNFNNVRRGNSPVELSFLKEFKDSSPVSEPVKSQIDLFSSKKPLQYDVPDDHLLLFSLSTTEGVGSNAPPVEPKLLGKEQYFNFMASPESNKIPPVVSDESAAPVNDKLLSKPEPFIDDFLARPKGSRSDVEQLRGVRKSSGVDDNHPPMQMSFKDFEIKSDLTTTVMMNTSLSTVGLDDSNILKAGFNDLTCPSEQVPACVSQLDITARTPKQSAAGNASFARSMMTPHAPGLDSIAENSPISKENSGEGVTKSEMARDPHREEDHTTHTSFSRPFYSYMPVPDKSDTTKHSQSFPSLDLEPTEVGLNHVEVTDASTKRQSMGPAVPRKSLLPQNLPESCSMELTDVLNQKSIPGRSSMNPMRVSKHDCTDMDLSVSICTDETLPGKSVPSAWAEQPSPERPSSMDETNLAEPATIFKEIKISQPAHDSPVSIASEETVCKSNVTNCAIERIEPDSGDNIHTEETFAKSKLTDEIPYQFAESAKKCQVPRVSQSHPQCRFFPRMSAREETMPSELTDNHLINAGLNSTFSFHNFGSKGSTENVLDPLRKIAAAFANVASDFHDDATQSGENLFAAHRASGVLGRAQPEDPITGKSTEPSGFDPPKSRIRISRKSNFFGNLEDDVIVEIPNVKLQPDGNSEVTIEKIESHASSSKYVIDEVVSHVSRKSVRVVPISNEESGDIVQPERDSENPNSRKSRGFPVEGAMQMLGKSGFTNLFGEAEASDGRSEEFEFNRKSMGPVDGKADSRVHEPVKIVPDFINYKLNDTLPSNQLSKEISESVVSRPSSVESPEEVIVPAVRKSIKITPSFCSESSETLPSNEPSEGSLKIAAEPSRKSVGFLGQEVDNQASRKSIKITPNFSSEGSSETLASNQPSGNRAENSHKSVGFLHQEVDNQASRKSIKITPNFSSEGSSETLASNQPSGNRAENSCKSVGFLRQEVDNQASRKSIKITPNFSSEGSSETLASNQPSGNRAENSRKSVGFLHQEVDNQASRKSIKITPNFSSEGSSETLPSNHPSGSRAENSRKSVGFLHQEVDNQASRRSIQVTPNFSNEGTSHPMPLVQLAERSLEHHQIPLPSCKSVGEVRSQAPKTSIRTTRDFNVEKPCDIMNEPLDASECAVDESALHRKSTGFFGQEGQWPGKSVKIIPDQTEESCDAPQQGGSAEVGDADNSLEDHSNDEETMESPVEPPKRAPRKSCIGVKMDSSSEPPKRVPRKSCIGVKMDSSSEIETGKQGKISVGNVSEEFEFAIKRNKRKSAVGVRRAPDADSDKESQNPELDSGIKVSNDDVQPGWSTDDDQKMSPNDRPDDHLSQGMMNVSINDDDMDDFTDDERMHVSTPCKPRLSSRLRDDDGRKRSLKPDTVLTSDDGGVHDLSQDLMNVSLESDTRSPMLKKTCASPQARLSVKPNSTRKSLAPMSPLADRCSSARESLPPQPTAKSGSAKKSLAPRKSIFECLALGPSSSTAVLTVPSSSTWTGGSGMAESCGSLWGLSHDVRVKNRDLMAANGFTHLNRQIYEVWLFDEVIGLKATFANCELDEGTDVVGVTYTFKDWKLKSDKEVYEFYKNRLLETLPEQQLKRDCRRVSDLFRIAQFLKKLNADTKPLIERMNYLKSRYPCQINENSIEFLIHDAQRMLKFSVKIDLRNDTLSEDSISVTNLRGQVKEDVIKLMFRVLPLQKDTFHTFIKELRNNTEKLLVAR